MIGKFLRVGNFKKCEGYQSMAEKGQRVLALAVAKLFRVGIPLTGLVTSTHPVGIPPTGLVTSTHLPEISPTPLVTSTHPPEIPPTPSNIHYKNPSTN